MMPHGNFQHRFAGRALACIAMAYVSSSVLGFSGWTFIGNPLVKTQSTVPFRKVTMTRLQARGGGAEEERMVDCLRKDLENIYVDGMTYTPISSDIHFVDPLISLHGRTPYAKLMLEPTVLTLKNLMEPGTARMEVKSINVVAGDYSIEDTAYPPKANAAKPSREASYAVHVVWETHGAGRLNLQIPGGVKLIQQKPFYFSGQDVFRVDSKGQVFRHDSAWDQAPLNMLSYFNPLAHLPLVESALPMFANMIPKKEEPETPE